MEINQNIKALSSLMHNHIPCITHNKRESRNRTIIQGLDLLTSLYKINAKHQTSIYIIMYMQCYLIIMRNCICALAILFSPCNSFLLCGITIHLPKCLQIIIRLKCIIIIYYTIVTWLSGYRHSHRDCNSSH